MCSKKRRSSSVSAATVTESLFAAVVNVILDRRGEAPRRDFHELAACSLAALMLVQLPRQRSDTSRRRRVRVSERLHKALEAANISCLTQ